jgi:hypothetical protein
MYGPNLRGANHYVAQTVTVTNSNGMTTTLPGTYPSNQLGMITAEVTYLKSQGFTFARIEDLYSGRRVRNWSSATSCAQTQPTSILDYQDNDTGGQAGSFSSSESYYRSFQLADVNGDYLADACARFGGGIECATNRGNGQFNPHTTWFGDNFLDAYGWDTAPYGSTVQFADVNGDGSADVCGRGGRGIYCATSNGTDGFGNFVLATNGIDFSDADHWADAESRYESVHFGDVNGDSMPDVCGRSPQGIVCAMNITPWGGTPRFGRASLWLGTNFYDAIGWGSPQYGATVQLGDVNGDGFADVCGRGNDGMVCALSTGAGFGDGTWWSTWPDFSDSDSSDNGWQDSGHYKSIRLVDINSDGAADVCGRTAGGIVCALSTRGSFLPATAMDYPRETTSGTGPTTFGNDFTDGLGWVPDYYGSTIQFGQLNYDGVPDVCGRGAEGLLCSLTQCVPKTCDGRCGTMSDGCGGVLNCGDYSCEGKRCGEGNGCGGYCLGYCAKVGYICTDDGDHPYCARGR